MTPTGLLLLNLAEVRRRSLMIWRGIPPDAAKWRPGSAARSCLETIRHVLSAEWVHMQMLRAGRRLDPGASPYDSQSLIDINSELEFAEPFRREFLTLIGSYTSAQLSENKIKRADGGIVRTFGDFILRIAYHEAVHAGQLLSYLRTMKIAMPKIWD